MDVGGVVGMKDIYRGASLKNMRPGVGTMGSDHSPRPDVSGRSVHAAVPGERWRR